MENNENAIEVRHVTKHFKVFFDKSNQLKERALFWKRNRFEERKVLNDVSFSIKKGEAVGLVGRNGCGKSTTLKLLTRIIYPNEGSIELNGRVSSLIELGAGFHPDMSGRENIYINASIFGLSKKEIDERLDDIIKFSELKEFIDNPVRTYSSGMYMRLAFSVAINVDADILLIDEILAVGDANFQAKCFNRLREIKQTGTTIVIVSHSLGQIEQICDRSIWIKDGHIEADGNPKDVHFKYLDFMNEERIAQTEAERADIERETQRVKEERKKSSRTGDRRAEFTKVQMLNSLGEHCTTLRTGDPMTLNLEYTVHEKVEDCVLGFAIMRSDGLWVYGTNTRIDRKPNFNIDKNGSYKVKFNEINLLPGEYWCDVTIEYGEGIPVDYYRQAIKFEVVSNVTDAGVVRLDHEWELHTN